MRVSFGVERSGYDKDQTKRSHKFVTRTNIPVEIIANIILDASNTGDGKSIGYDRSSASVLSPSSCFLRAASTTARVVGSIFSVASINSVGDRSLNEFVFVVMVVVAVLEGSGGRPADVGSSLSVGVTNTLVLECIVVVVVVAINGDDNHECLV